MPYCHAERVLLPLPFHLLTPPTVQDAKRLMPQMDVAHTLRTNPEMVLMNLKGKHLIPYDPAWPVVNKPPAQAP